MAEDKYSRKNPAVKRILQEVKEMQSNPPHDFISLPLEENLFEWHFSIRGPRIYHGRIQLPAEYPFKPPSFMLLTPNGRFKTQTKICLSISNYHPEHWQPSWSVRTALVALIAFMPTSPNGALGSLDYTKEERRALAMKAREVAPKFGSPGRQKLIGELHEYMLSKAFPVPQGILDTAVQTNNRESEAQETSDGDIVGARETEPHPAEDDEIVREPNRINSNENVAEASNSVLAVPANEQQLLQKPEPRVPKQADDCLLTWAAFGLTIDIVVLLLKKFMKAGGHGFRVSRRYAQ